MNHYMKRLYMKVKKVKKVGKIKNECNLLVIRYKPNLMII